VSTFAKDFDRLSVGERFVTRGRTIGESDITGFATLSGDTHPQHTDAEWAAGSRFGERIAHGLLVLSYASGLMAFDPERIVALRRVSDAVFKQPVTIGDPIHVEGEVVDKHEIDAGYGLVSTHWRVMNQRGKLVARATVDLVWRRESTPLVDEPRANTQPVLI
jgi:3-hydroxybutyryl-CoA dehydratase